MATVQVTRGGVGWGYGAAERSQSHSHGSGRDGSASPRSRSRRLGAPWLPAQGEEPWTKKTNAPNCTLRQLGEHSLTTFHLETLATTEWYQNNFIENICTLGGGQLGRENTCLFRQASLVNKPWLIIIYVSFL